MASEGVEWHDKPKRKACRVGWFAIQKCGEMISASHGVLVRVLFTALLVVLARPNIGEEMTT
jgi:hypothetical protein